MKRLILLIALVVLVVILAGSSAPVVSDTSPIDSNIPDNETIISQTEASNSSASATITITMTGIVGDPGDIGKENMELMESSRYTDG